MLNGVSPADETFRVHHEDVGRLDKTLTARFPQWSRSSLQKLINHRSVLVDNHPASPNHKLLIGQTVQIWWPKKKGKKAVGAIIDLPFPILFEDDHMLVVNKPAGLVVHPSAGHMDGDTLVELVEPRLSQREWPDDMRPGLVHRLDRDTSGVIILAKTLEDHSRLSAQFSKRQVKKVYHAIAKGSVGPNQGILESHLARHPGLRQRFAVSSSQGRWASTKFIVKERLKDKATLLELHPLTGRTHQIRVHLASFQHPIVGDHVYGTNDKEFSFVKRHMLHASSLEFFHPVTKKSMKIEAPWPLDFQETLKLIRLIP